MMFQNINIPNCEIIADSSMNINILNPTKKKIV
jgi:hypothetical protein